jgi:hypothetical protein
MAPQSISGVPFETVRVVGLDDSDDLIVNPVALVRVGDELYIVSRDQGQVIVVSSDTWETRRRFGDLGEGPGLLFHPSDLCVVNDDVWVVEQGYLSRYTNSGEFRSKVATPSRYRSLEQLDDRLIGVEENALGETVAWVFDPEDVETRDPINVSSSDGHNETARGMSWSSFGGPGGAAVLMNSFTGEVVLVSPSGEATSIDLDIPPGEAKLKRGAWHWTHAVAGLTWGEQGWIRADAPGEAASGFSLSLRAVETNSWTQPMPGSEDGIYAGKLEHAPGENEFYVIDPWSSVIVVMTTRGPK